MGHSTARVIYVLYGSPFIVPLSVMGVMCKRMKNFLCDKPIVLNDRIKETLYNFLYIIGFLKYLKIILMDPEILRFK